MPLGVLSVDIDKLLKNEVKTWSSEIGGLTPFRTPQRNLPYVEPSQPQQQQHVPSHPATPSTLVRRIDAYLIRGHDESRPWNGAVIRGHSALDGHSNAESPKRVMRSSATTSRRRRRELQRALRGGSQPDVHNNKSSDAATVSDATVSPAPGDDMHVDDEEMLDSCPVIVKLSWVPHQSYRHCTMSMTRRELGNPITDGDSYGVPSEIPSLPQTPGLRSTAGSRGATVPSPRLGSATAGRTGSARRVRLVGIDDGTEGNDGVRSHPPHLGTTAAAGRVGVPPRAPAAPQPPNASSEVKPSNDGGAPLSATAAEIIANSVEYVKNAIQTLVDRTAAHSGKLKRPADEGADEASSVNKRLLLPRRPSTVDAFGNVTDGEHPHRRTSRMDMIARELRTSPRRASVRQEHEHQQAVREFRRLSVGNTLHPSLPSTLTTFQPSLQGKSDATFPAVFQVEYVRPPRYRVPLSQTARQRRLDTDGLTSDERRTYDLIVNASAR